MDIETKLINEAKKRLKDSSAYDLMDRLSSLCQAIDDALRIYDLPDILKYSALLTVAFRLNNMSVRIWELLAMQSNDAKSIKSKEGKYIG